MKMIYWKYTLIGFVLAAVAVVGGCQHEEAGSAGPKEPTVGVVQPITRPVTEYAYFTGQIQALDSVDLRARVTGYLQTICYMPGTIVKKDTVLFEIDPLPYQAQVDIAKGKLAEANAQVLDARAKVAQAAARVELDRSRLAIDREVAKTSGAISKLKIEEDEAQVKESEATWEASKATVLAIEASVKAAEASLAYNQLNLDWTKVRSPITGRVDRNLLTVGNLVTADVTTLTNIVTAEDVYVYFDVDELSCLEIQKELRENGYQPTEVPIDVALQNEQDYPHPGVVDVTANRMNESTGTLKVRGILKNTKKILTAGNFVRVRVALGKAEDRLLVPEKAVIYEQGETFALVVDAKNTVTKRKISVGSLDSNDKSLRIVESGLKAGEWVVVEGRQRIRQPGMTVKPERMTISGKPAAASPSPSKAS